MTTDVDPYVGPPAEPAPTPRLANLRTWLVLAIVLLLIAAWFGSQIVAAHQDPTLQFPGGATAPPATGQPANVPTATE